VQLDPADDAPDAALARLLEAQLASGRQERLRAGSAAVRRAPTSSVLHP
ncbi:MAG: hypothetical protein GX886_15485, partial [Comamonadaceae bacterium]|nr:hypothetical protein [Comamonadaceae bacterium]